MIQLNIFLAAGDFYLGLFFFCCFISFVALVTGVILAIKKESKAAKIAFIVFGISLLIGLGSCGMFWNTFSFNPR